MHHSSRPALGPPLQGIIVYPHRWRTSVWLLLGGVSSVLLWLGCLVVLILMIVIPETRNITALFLTLMLMGVGWVGFLATRTVASVMISGTPMLVINQQGIRVGKLYRPFDIVLPWEEIAAIYLHSNGMEKQLCIRPTNIKVFLSHFSPFMRFFLRINLMNGAPIAISQSFLDQPIGVILQQLQQRYAQELEAHQVQLRPPHIR